MKGELQMNNSDLNPLGAISIAAFAVQQILEILSPFVEWLLGESRKKMALGVISICIGLLLAYVFGLRVLLYAGVTSYGPGAGTLDLIVTGFLLGTGTEGVNSILKFLKYLKEDKKLSAVGTVQSIIARSETLPSLASVTPSAMRTFDKLRAAAKKDPGRAITSIT